MLLERLTSWPSEEIGYTSHLYNTDQFNEMDISFCQSEYVIEAP